MEVQLVINRTSDNLHPKGFNTWVEFFKFINNENITCSVVGCNHQAEQGIHGYKCLETPVGSYKFGNYIIPLCEEHNGYYKTKDELYVDADRIIFKGI